MIKTVLVLLITRICASWNSGIHYILPWDLSFGASLGFVHLTQNGLRPVSKNKNSLTPASSLGQFAPFAWYEQRTVWKPTAKASSPDFPRHTPGKLDR